MKYFHFKSNFFKEKIYEPKIYEHGAHFKYMDLFSKLVNLITVLPSKRVGRNGVFFQEETHSRKHSCNLPLLLSDKSKQSRNNQSYKFPVIFTSPNCTSDNGNHHMKSKCKIKVNKNNGLLKIKLTNNNPIILRKRNCVYTETEGNLNQQIKMKRVFSKERSSISGLTGFSEISKNFTSSTYTNWLEKSNQLKGHKKSKSRIFNFSNKQIYNSPEHLPSPESRPFIQIW